MDVITKERHGLCIRFVVPVGEAMVACVIVDHYLRHCGQVSCIGRKSDGL